MLLLKIMLRCIMTLAGNWLGTQAPAYRLLKEPAFRSASIPPHPAPPPHRPSFREARAGPTKCMEKGGLNIGKVWT